MSRSVVALLLPALLSGCAEVGSVVVDTAIHTALSRIGSDPAEDTPRVLCATPGSITVEYRVSLLDDQTEAAMALIADHCGSTYTVTQEVWRFAWHAVDARCDRPQAEPDSVPPCAYKFPDNMDPGQEGEGLP